MDRKARDINLAREVGFNTEHPATNEWLHQYAQKVRAEEREACAKVCDEHEQRYRELWSKFDYLEDQGRALASVDLASAIRARDNK